MPKTINAGGAAKRHSLNMRTTEEIRLKLEKAAQASGRSLVQEVEKRVEQTFEQEENYIPQQGSIIVRTVVQTLRAVEISSGGRYWLDDQEMKAKTRAAIIAVLDILMPESETHDDAEHEGRAAAAHVYQEHAAKIIQERAPDLTPLTVEQILENVEQKAQRRKGKASAD